MVSWMGLSFPWNEESGSNWSTVPVARWRWSGTWTRVPSWTRARERLRDGVVEFQRRVLDEHAGDERMSGRTRAVRGADSPKRVGWAVVACGHEA